MTRQELSVSVINALRPFTPGRKSADINPSMKLVVDLDINSARLVDIVLELEDRFGISIEDSAMDEFLTVGDVIDLVDSRISKQLVS